MTRRRYHVDFGLPSVPLRPTAPLRWTDHARRQLREDGFEQPVTSVSEAARCIEVTLNQDGSVWRWLLRQPLNTLLDLCLVIEAGGTVVTCWVNGKWDHHRTLNRALYQTPMRG